MDNDAFVCLLMCLFLPEIICESQEIKTSNNFSIECSTKANHPKNIPSRHKRSHACDRTCEFDLLAWTSASSRTFNFKKKFHCIFFFSKVKKENSLINFKIDWNKIGCIAAKFGFNQTNYSPFRWNQLAKAFIQWIGHFLPLVFNQFKLHNHLK